MQLPRLCRENEHRLMAFHTNGDVTIDKLLTAVGRLVEPAHLTLITPTIDDICAKQIFFRLKKGWLTDFSLITSPKQDINIPADIRSLVTHITDRRISESSCMFVLEGESRRICITGYMPTISPADSDNHYRLVTHTMLYTNSEPPQSLIWDELTRIPLSPLRIHG